MNYAISGTASSGVDYLMIADSVTIRAGERSARIIISPIDDRIVEETETVILSLLQPTSQSAPYTVGWPGKAAAIIVDNDGGPPGNCRLCDGTFHLTLPGTSGSSYRVEASFDLVHWVTLGTNTVLDMNLHIADPEWHDFPNRFYRAVPERTQPLLETTAY